jgi:hypothetical protein
MRRVGVLNCGEVLMSREDVTCRRATSGWNRSTFQVGQRSGLEGGEGLAGVVDGLSDDQIGAALYGPAHHLLEHVPDLTGTARPSPGARPIRLRGAPEPGRVGVGVDGDHHRRLRAGRLLE